MGAYNVQLETTKKNILVKVEGKFTPTDAEGFVNELNKNVQKVNAKEYSLSFDAKSLQVSQQEMLPILENCFKLYKAIGFKKVIMDIGGSAVHKMQINRVAKKAGLENWEVF